MDILRLIHFGFSFAFGPLIASLQSELLEKVNRFRANGWQPAQGTVHQVSVFQDNAYWHADLAYSYSWEGEFYSGFRRRSFGRENGADEFVTTFPQGASLIVRVNADHPESSILLLDEQFVRI